MFLTNYCCAMEKAGAMVVCGQGLSMHQRVIFDVVLDTIENNNYECTNYDGPRDVEYNPLNVCIQLKSLRKEIDRSICAASNRYELALLLNLLRCSPYKNTIKARYNINIKQTAIRQTPHDSMITLFGIIKKHERQHNFDQIIIEDSIRDAEFKNTLRLLSLTVPNVVLGKKIPLLSYVVGKSNWFLKKICISLLRNPSCNVNAVDENGDTALLIACKNASFEHVCALVQHAECDPFCTDQSGLNALKILTSKEQTAEIKALITLVQAKMDSYKKNADNICKILQRKSPDADYISRLQKEISNVTYYALQDLSLAQKWDKVVDWLCYGSGNGYAVMLDDMYNTRFGLAFTIADYLEKKLFVQKQLETIQKYHAQQSKEDMLNFDLIQRNNVHNLIVLSLIYPNLIVDSSGTPLLSYCIKRAQECGDFWHAIPQLIYNDSCDVNKQDSCGLTPMHHAVKADNQYAVRHLLESGRHNRFLHDKAGLFPLDYLLKSKGDNREEIMRLFGLDRL